MTLKKALCAVMALIMLFALTACKGEGGEVKELTITLNGVTVSAPFTVEMLGSDYSVKYDTVTKIGQIFYKDQNLAVLVTFDENTSESDFRKKNIKTINGRENVSINGITKGSSKSDVKSAIGSPTDTEKFDEGLWAEGWLYCKGGKKNGETYLYIMFDKNDKVSYQEVDLELL